MAFVFCHFSSKLGAERVSASARLLGRWVVELESTLLNALVVIDRGAFKEQSALFVDHDIDAVLLGLAVVGSIKICGNVQAVAQPAASAAGNANT